MIAVTQLVRARPAVASRERVDARGRGPWPLAIVAAGPVRLGRPGLFARLPPFLGAYLDNRTGSTFPLFPYAAFVLAGTVAGAALGRQEPRVRHRRAVGWGLGLLAAGAVLGLRCSRAGWTTGASPPPTCSCASAACCCSCASSRPLRRAGLPGTEALALLGRETLLVFVLHLYLLFGGITGAAPLGALRWAVSTSPGRCVALVLLVAGAPRRRLALALRQAPRSPRGVARAHVRERRLPLRVPDPALVGAGLPS